MHEEDPSGLHPCDVTEPRGFIRCRIVGRPLRYEFRDRNSVDAFYNVSKLERGGVNLESIRIAENNRPIANESQSDR